MNNWNDNNDENSQTSEEINVTPLVDTALVLLLVFMVATPVIMNQAIKVKLPKVANSKSVKFTTVALTLKKDDKLFLNGKELKFNELRTKVSKLIEREKEKAKRENNQNKVQAIISADKDVPHGKVMHLVDVIKDVGIEEFAYNIKKVTEVPPSP
ncbi:MAG: biopolymer transporter ExbD [Deltaproteobacteria bacterium]|jgi:biopolymer transport protein ExbD|nr:biopolymer transporter ExbD [Deltaproteobacteria bacterium]